MAIDPVGAPLAAFEVFVTILKGCKKTYDSYKLTKSFGADFQFVQWELWHEWVKLEALSRLPLVGPGTGVDIGNEETKLAIKQRLLMSQMRFEKCKELMEIYQNQGRTSRYSNELNSDC